MSIKVRSASFDEITLESQRAAQYLLNNQSSTDSQSALLSVPSNQRSRSFDSAGIESTDANASFLDIPRQRFRRKSSAKAPICIHCQYVEEQRKRGSTAGFYFDAQEFRSLTYSTSSSSSSSESEEPDEARCSDEIEDQEQQDDDIDVDYYFQTQTTLLLPSPCSITFTLSPTNCDYPAFPLPVAVVPSSPPALPSTPPVFPTSPTIEFTHDLDEIEIPGPRQRRRSISRQEAVFVEPTGSSLENVSNTSETEQQQHEEERAAKENDESERRHSDVPKASEPFVRDIFLTVPDLKRDRAASVDSCFTKVTSAAKTEEVQPAEGDLNLLTVPNSGAVRSRSVDIVLPTEQQARYKALALAGPASNIYNKG
jgi:diacylglycerol kinase (ATP)